MTDRSADADEWTTGIEGGYEGDDCFDYDAFVHREFGEGANGSARFDLKQLLYVLMVILVLVSVLAYFF